MVQQLPGAEQQSGAECLHCQPEHSDLPGLILLFLLLTAGSTGVLQGDLNVKGTEIWWFGAEYKIPGDKDRNNGCEMAARGQFPLPRCSKAPSLGFAAYLLSSAEQDPWLGNLGLHGVNGEGSPCTQHPGNIAMG